MYQAASSTASGADASLLPILSCRCRINTPWTPAYAQTPTTYCASLVAIVADPQLCGYCMRLSLPYKLAVVTATIYIPMQHVRSCCV